jgi:hypothetical protein
MLLIANDLSDAISGLAEFRELFGFASDVSTQTFPPHELPRVVIWKKTVARDSGKLVTTRTAREQKRQPRYLRGTRLEMLQRIS